MPTCQDGVENRDKVYSCNTCTGTVLLVSVDTVWASVSHQKVLLLKIILKFELELTWGLKQVHAIHYRLREGGGILGWGGGSHEHHVATKTEF